MRKRIQKVAVRLVLSEGNAFLHFMRDAACQPAPFCWKQRRSGAFARGRAMGRGPFAFREKLPSITAGLVIGTRYMAPFFGVDAALPAVSRLRMTMGGTHIWLLTEDFCRRCGTRCSPACSDAVWIKYTSPRGKNWFCCCAVRIFRAACCFRQAPKGRGCKLAGDSPENPAVPPMFCMLMRKRLVGARLSGMEQPGLERILKFHFEGKNELGDTVSLSLVVEMMGRRSNIILCDEDMRVIDAVRRTDAADAVRVLMPGVRYQLPPPQDKVDPMLGSIEPLWERLAGSPEKELSKALLEHLQGASPLVCRELAHAACRGKELRVEQMEEADWQRLKVQLTRWLEALQGRGASPTIGTRSGRPADGFLFYPHPSIRHGGHDPGISRLL